MRHPLNIVQSIEDALYIRSVWLVPQTAGDGLRNHLHSMRDTQGWICYPTTPEQYAQLIEATEKAADELEQAAFRYVWNPSHHAGFGEMIEGVDKSDRPRRVRVLRDQAEQLREASRDPSRWQRPDWWQEEVAAVNEEARG